MAFPDLSIDGSQSLARLNIRSTSFRARSLRKLTAASRSSVNKPCYDRQSGLLAKIGILPQMPIVRIVDRPSSTLLVDKDTHRGFIPDDLPTAAPSWSDPPAGHQPQNQQKNHRPNEGVHDQRDDASAKVNAESRQQPVAYKCAEQAHDQIADKTKTATLHHSAGQPARDYSHNYDD